MKTCNNCGNLLPPTHFGVDRSAKDGLQRTCRACRKVYDQQRVRVVCTACGSTYQVCRNQANRYAGKCVSCSGKPHTQALNPNWKGGKTKHIRGYILVHNPSHPRAHNGYVFEHILTAERVLGRNLLSRECVHHINQNTSDNRAINLQVMTRGQHNALHRKLYQESRGRLKA